MKFLHFENQSPPFFLSYLVSAKPERTLRLTEYQALRLRKQRYLSSSKVEPNIAHCPEDHRTMPLDRGNPKS
jgi:hypothetical protein